MSIVFLEETAKHTKFTRNSEQDKSGLHPDWTAEQYAVARDPFEALGLFAESLTMVNDYDDGDWKRQVTAQIFELEHNLSQQSPWVLATLQNMRGLVNWSYREDLENIRIELLKRAEGIRHGIQKLGK